MQDFQKKIDKIEEACEHIKERVASIDTNVAINTVCLKEHMRRTELNEAAINVLYDETLPPIKDAVDKMLFIVKATPWVLGVLATIMAIVYKTGISLF